MPVAGLRIRPEAGGDEAAIRALTDAAFAPSTDEGRIVDALRHDPIAWRPELSIVAVDEALGGRIVGHVVTSVGSLEAADGVRRPILGLGPLSVAPDTSTARPAPAGPGWPAWCCGIRC